MKRHQIGSERNFQIDFKLCNTLTTWKNNGVFTQAVKESADTVLGKRRGSNKVRWISANSWKLIDEHKVAKATRDQARTRLGWRHKDEVYWY